MTYKNIVIAGGGTLGSQIAYMAAYSGKNTTIWGRSAGSLERAQARVAVWENEVQAYFKSSDASKQAAQEHLHYTTDLANALADADLVIEALPEDLATKEAFYREFAKLAPDKTVVVTNSSTLLPSSLAESTGRPAQFLGYHFANQIWRGNTAEIMAGPATDKTLVDSLVTFSHEIKMVPIVVKKEQAGYVLNSMLVPLLSSASQLWVDDIAEPSAIDKTWMIATGAPMGPFAIMDMVGMHTVYAINHANPDPKAQLIANKIKAMIDAGNIGVESGQGFYSYPNPAFQNANFLKA
ncbi:possible 3-hydroxybutyryl-CoA dehydrogenase [Weissella oryzae SG25]|uniref:Possible 3-hydroxybutyryl-CoA dehydrogenase n=1 Tax=Weissella oryzae (strain DSM 25784 / JCM 18191 / LMG 30913 / SG25) TaxID=1329250 RepID=A0A069CS90_WEIOS|nr:3-hydroxyacyl-CoA dehydrogenase [Weissella oryzae]GAK30294.1 possible 3-hydroxybutyryl-CoA dehydrogenase [Weissella oryzae SG25]